MKLVIRIFFLFITGMVVEGLISNSNGPNGGYSGAPSENNCTSCHGSFSLQTSGLNYNKIKLDIPFTGGGYIPDSTYLIKISYKESGKSVFGFQITALDAKNYDAAGTFSANDSRTQTGNYTISGKTRYYAEHTNTGKSAVATDSVAWLVKWKAPNKNVGTVRFYLNLNVTNNNGGTSGDYIYSKSFDYTPSTLLPKASPSIKDSLVCSGKSIQFIGTGTQSPTSYQWSFPGGSITSSTSQNPTVTYATTGSYMAILTVKNSKGTSLPDTLLFKVLQGATKPTLNLSGTVNICSGDSIRLNANNITGHTISWMPVNNKKNSLFAKDSGIYYAVSTNSVGCTRNSDNIFVKVLQRPTAVIVTLGGGKEFCLNSQVPLQVYGKLTAIDSFSVTSATAGFSKDSNFFKKAAIKGNISFSGWVKAANGCVSAPGKTSVTVVDSLEGPIISIKDTQLTNATFSWPHALGNKYNFSTNAGSSWNFPSISDSSNQQLINTPTANYSIQFWLKSISNYACKESKISKLKINTLSCNPIDFSYTAKPRSKSCSDSLLELKLTTKISDYAWAINGDTLKNSSSFQFKLKAGKNSISLALLNNKESICGFTVKQFQWNAEFQPSLLWSSPASSNNYCRAKSNDTIQLPIQVSSNIPWANLELKNKLFTQLLNRNEKNLVGIVSRDQPNIIFMVQTDSGCLFSDTAISCSIQSLPSADFVVSNPSDYHYSFNAVDLNLKSYQWKIADSTSANNLVDLDLYAYRGTRIPIRLDVVDDGNGCSNSKTDSLIVALTGLFSQSGKSTISIFPNPALAGDMIYFQGINPALHSPSAFRVTILDQTGKIVLTQNMDFMNLGLGIGLAEFSEGIYSVKISTIDDKNSETVIAVKPIVIGKNR